MKNLAFFLFVLIFTGCYVNPQIATLGNFYNGEKKTGYELIEGKHLVAIPRGLAGHFERGIKMNMPTSIKEKDPTDKTLVIEYFFTKFNKGNHAARFWKWWFADQDEWGFIEIKILFKDKNGKILETTYFSIPATRGFFGGSVTSSSYLLGESVSSYMRNYFFSNQPYKENQCTAIFCPKSPNTSK